MLRNSFKSVVLAAVTAIAMVINPALAEDKGWPRTIQHELGELTIEKQPKRVVNTALSATGTLLAIDAPVIASSATRISALTDDKGFFSQWADVAHERGVEILYPNLEFDLEAIIAADPDLLIISTTGGDSVKEHYDELVAQGIPTMAVNYSNKKWQDLAAQFGEALGLEAEAKEAADRFDAYVADLAKTIDLPEGPVSIVGFNIGTTQSVSKTTSPQAHLLSAMGFDVHGIAQGIPAEDRGGRSDFSFVTFENLSAGITGDTVFLLRGTEKNVEAFLNEPTFANLSAVKSKQVYPLGFSSFRIDYYSGKAMADTVAKFFAK